MADFKYLIFFAVLLVGVPGGVWLALVNPRFERLMFIMMLFTSFITEIASINFFSFQDYRGTSRGMETTITDLCTLVVLAALFIRSSGRFRLLVPGIVFYILYCLLSLISFVNSESRLFSFMEIWKMLRMMIFFITVYNYLCRRDEALLLLRVFGWCAVINFAEMIRQKYLGGIYQPSGLLSHQNSMAMYMSLFGPIFLSLWLNVRMARSQRIFFAIAFIVASGSCVLTYSRGALATYPLGCGLVLAVSLFRRPNWRKMRIVSLLGVIGLSGLLAMLPTLVERFLHAPEASANTRINLVIAAKNMANDKFFGVGLNNWGIKINPPYTYSEHRTSSRYTEDFKDGLVETIYMMAAAECGWIGLASLLLWFGYYGFAALRLALARGAPDFFNWLGLGAAGGLCCNYLQSALEWVLKQTVNFYALMAVFALIAYAVHSEHMSRRRAKTYRRAIGQPRPEGFQGDT